MALTADPIFWGHWRDLTFARRADPNIYRWGFLGAWPTLSVDEKRRLLRGLLEGSPASGITGAHRVYVLLAQQYGNTETSLIRAADAIARAIDADNLRRARLGIPIPGITNPGTKIKARRSIASRYLNPMPTAPAFLRPAGQADAGGAEWPVEAKIFAAVDLASTVASTYHGYRRTGSVGWALAWGAAGAMFPIITPTIAVAQGFAKPERKGRRK